MIIASRNGSKQWRGVSMAFPASVLVFTIMVMPFFLLFRDSLNHFEPGALVASGLTLENYRRFFTDSFYREILSTTLEVALFCTVSALVLGFPVAYFLAKTRSRFKSQFIILLVFPLMVGNVVRAAGWMIVLGNAGVVNSILLGLRIATQPVQFMYTPLAVIISTTAVVMPYMILTLQSVLEGIDFSLEEAAQNLGASFLKTFFRIVLPIAAPGVAAGTMLVFILCMNAYATPVLLGGTGITMMAPALYDQITKASNWPFGATMALILVCVTLAFAIFSNRLIHRRYVKTMQS